MQVVIITQCIILLKMEINLYYITTKQIKIYFLIYKILLSIDYFSKGIFSGLKVRFSVYARLSVRLAYHAR